MDGNTSRRKGRDLVVTLPPPSASASNSNTPRALLKSLVRFPKYCIRKGKRGGDEREDDDNEEFVGATNLSLSPMEKREVGCAERRELEEAAMSSSGKKPEAVSSTVGVGAGLIFLLVRSTSEFNKMIELRKQMEILLKDFKCAMQRKNATSSYSVSNNYNVLSESKCWGDESTSKETDAHCKCQTTFEKKRCWKINQLEEELEAELERLQMKTEEDSSVVQEQQSVEMESENINHSESFSASLVEASNEAKQEDTKELNGVCPHELERRLHELLESRQQVRIAELESALECAERKLREKESEICWWHDTARLVSKHKDVMHDEENISGYEKKSDDRKGNLIGEFGTFILKELNSVCS